MRILSRDPHSATSTNPFAGIDHLSLDRRTFDPSQSDIERLCRFFSLGKLKHYQKEKDIVVSHSNFFVFVETDQGPYALKFYPTDEAETIKREHTLNRFLIGHHFRTPVMYSGRDGQPFLTSTGRLAACFSYVNGQQAWQQIKQRNIIIRINAAMCSLKEILVTARGRLPLRKQENLTSTINTLNRTSQTLSPFKQEKMITASLKNACQTYKRFSPLFIRQWLHNNASLTNFLVSQETVYTLDLSHIREDYALSDLANLIISCLFLKVPEKTVKMIVKDYFIQHKISPKHTPVLNTLVQIKLIGEYLKNVRREKSVEPSTHPADLMRIYRSQLSARMLSIATFLQPKAIDHLV